MYIYMYTSVYIIYNEHVGTIISTSSCFQGEVASSEFPPPGGPDSARPGDPYQLIQVGSI